MVLNVDNGHVSVLGRTSNYQRRIKKIKGKGNEENTRGGEKWSGRRWSKGEDKENWNRERRIMQHKKIRIERGVKKTVVCIKNKIISGSGKIGQVKHGSVNAT